MLKHINVFEYTYWRWKIKGGIEGGMKDIRKGENNCLCETEGTVAREKVNGQSRWWGCNAFLPPGGSGLRLSQLVFVTLPNQVLKCVFHVCLEARVVVEGLGRRWAWWQLLDILCCPDLHPHKIRALSTHPLLKAAWWGHLVISPPCVSPPLIPSNLLKCLQQHTVLPFCYPSSDVVGLTTSWVIKQLSGLDSSSLLNLAMPLRVVWKMR